MANQPPTANLTYVDRPEVSETYADSLEGFSLTGPIFRMEFVVHRFDPPGQGMPPSGKKYTACRVVLPADAMLDMASKLNGLIAVLQKQGAIKMVTHPEPDTGGKPN